MGCLCLKAIITYLKCLKVQYSDIYTIGTCSAVVIDEPYIRNFIHLDIR